MLFWSCLRRWEINICKKNSPFFSMATFAIPVPYNFLNILKHAKAGFLVILPSNAGVYMWDFSKIDVVGRFLWGNSKIKYGSVKRWLIGGKLCSRPTNISFKFILRNKKEHQPDELANTGKYAAKWTSEILLSSSLLELKLNKHENFPFLTTISTKKTSIIVVDPDQYWFGRLEDKNKPQI